jgi:predicted permease
MFRRKRSEKDFARELHSHMEIEADQLREEGWNPYDASRQARRSMGNLTRRVERYYEATRWMWLNQFRQDLRHALRQLRKSQGFAAVAILTLALGIGANTAIFTVVHAVMLKSLPVADPQRLYRLGSGDDCCVNGGYASNFSLYAHPLYLYMRDHTPEMEELAAFSPSTMPLSVHRTGATVMAQALDGEIVSGNYFAMFGVQPFAGRMLTAADDQSAAAPAAVMSYRAWEQNYALDPAVIGATFVLNGVAYTIAGISPPGFFGDTLRANPPDFWLPLGTEPALRGKNTLLRDKEQRWLYLVGRVRSGTLPAALEAKVNVELKQWFLENRHGDVNLQRIAQQHIQVTPAGSGVTTLRDGYHDALRILMLVSGFVLLIACANVANLLLARGTAGRMQASIRLALGASRNRLMRQSLTESMVLALAGAVAGVGVAFWGARLLLRLAFSGARWVPINPDPSWPVLGFAFLLALTTGVIFGAVPGWSAARLHPVEALRGASRSTGNRATLPQKSLVVLQAGLSVVLIAGAGVLTGSLRNLENQHFGFATEGRLLAQVNLASGSYSPDRLFHLYQQLEQDLPRIPGVRSAAFSLYEPMSGGGWSSGIFFEERPVPAGVDTRDSALWVRVSQHYFETIGVRLLEGRRFDARDTPSSPKVAIVSQAFARKFFPSRNAIGKHFGMNRLPRDYESSASSRTTSTSVRAKMPDPRSFCHSYKCRPTTGKAMCWDGPTTFTPSNYALPREPATWSRCSAANSPESIPISQSCACGVFVSRWTATSTRNASSRGSPSCLPGWRCFWPRWDSTASRPTRWRGAPAKSESAQPSAHPAEA